MKFKTLNSNKHRIILFGGVVCVVILLITFVITNSLAKYKTTQSMPLINGTVNYDTSDLNAVAVYLENESATDGYAKANTIPTSGYTLNEEMSYCTIDGNRDDSISLNYNADIQSLSVSPMATAGTKCYLYFDEQASIRDTLLSYYPNILTRDDFSITVTETTTGTIYQTTDWDGTTYYFAGNPTDNWVQFAGYYWRIIRVNGDGTIRLIYNGTNNSQTGSSTQIGESTFNSSYNRSYYVGLSYSTTQHGTGTESTILGELNDWYNGLSTTNKNYIDRNAGFCSDRNMASGYTWDDQPDDDIYYATYERLASSKTPSLNCSTSDILNIPVGLITADEVAFAGGVYNSSNSDYYLYTNSVYWTMSPFYFFVSRPNSFAIMFRVWSTGVLNIGNVSEAIGVRPVINLKADTAISSGNGTSSNPFVIA